MNTRNLLKNRLSQATKAERDEISKALKLNEPSSITDREIIDKYLRAGGNSVINCFRWISGESVDYKTILIDVADKLASGFSFMSWTDYSLDDHNSIETIENDIIEQVNKKIADAISKLTPEKKMEFIRKTQEELKKRGYSQSAINGFNSAVLSGSIAFLLANTVATSIFYSGFMASIYVSIFGPASLYVWLSGTGVGLAVAIPMLALDLARPAYRKTIPATIQLIMIRKRSESEKNL